MVLIHSRSTRFASKTCKLYLRVTLGKYPFLILKNLVKPFFSFPKKMALTCAIFYSFNTLDLPEYPVKELM